MEEYEVAQNIRGITKHSGFRKSKNQNSSEDIGGRNKWTVFVGLLPGSVNVKSFQIRLHWIQDLVLGESTFGPPWVLYVYITESVTQPR